MENFHYFSLKIKQRITNMLTNKKMQRLGICNTSLMKKLHIKIYKRKTLY